jgi:very-short-patch-repair endonuclease
LSPRKQRKANRHREPSELENKVMSWLREDRIKYSPQHPIGKDPVCHADLLLNTRTVIELNGCHWHGCRICNRKLQPWQEERQKKDGSRYDFFKKQGFDVVVIWEHEVNDEPLRVRAMLRAIAANRGR